MRNKRMNRLAATGRPQGEGIRAELEQLFARITWLSREEMKAAIRKISDDGMTQCPKCGSYRVTTGYYPKGRKVAQGIRMKNVDHKTGIILMESLARTCGNCKYVWMDDVIGAKNRRTR